MMHLGPYVALASVGRSLELKVQVSPDKHLEGTIYLPSQEPMRAAMLIVPGSGPTDRDGNNPYAVSSSPYRSLAQELAKHGIATLRTDKRGIGRSAAALAREEDSTLQLNAEDTSAWVNAFRTRFGLKCVWLLGHSEGGLVAMIAAKGNANVCGVVLISTPGRPAGEILREQLRANPGNAPILEQALDVLQTLEAGGDVDSGKIDKALLPLFRPSVQPHLRSLFAVDPVHLLDQLICPILVLQGENDLQVSVQDAKRLASSKRVKRLVILPGVNHIMKEAPVEPQANLATYKDSSAISAAVVEAIVRFVLEEAK